MTLNSTDPQEIDFEAWRAEIRTFADQIKQSLNSIGDTLLTGKTETEKNVLAEAEEIAQQIDNLTNRADSADVANGGRLNQLRAKLARKISGKNS